MPTLNDLMRALVAELEEGEVPTPLAQRFTLANLWDDLARLAGETVPAEVAALALDQSCELRFLRGVAADEARRSPGFGAEAWFPAD